MYQALKWLKLKNVLWIKIMYDKTLNFGFNQDLNQLKDTVYRFAQNEISPLAKEVDEKLHHCHGVNPSSSSANYRPAITNVTAP